MERMGDSQHGVASSNHHHLRRKKLATRQGYDGDVRKKLVTRQGYDARMSPKPFDGGKVECTDAANHGLMVMCAKKARQRRVFH